MAKLSINYPVFRHAPAVTFGRGSIRSAGDGDNKETAYLLSGAGAVRDYLAQALGRSGLELTDANCLVKSAGEPDAPSIREAATFLSRRPFRRIVAVGGGSVLDWARLAWAQAAGVIDLDTGKLETVGGGGQRPQFWLAPTTCGTGAEAADVVVYSRDDGDKQSVISPAFAAEKVILDGRFLDALPAPQLASFVSDALSHAVEAYVSIVPGTLAKASAVSALQIISSVDDSLAGELSHSQQDRLMEASFLAGVAAANCSVGIVHAFAHSIGQDDVPHGLANAAALQTGIDFNAETSSVGGLAQALGLADAAALGERVGCVTRIALESWQEYPALARLSEADYRAEIAERMTRDVTLRSNPRRPTPEERLAFVEAVAERLLS